MDGVAVITAVDDIDARRAGDGVGACAALDLCNAVQRHAGEVQDVARRAAGDHHIGEAAARDQFDPGEPAALEADDHVVGGDQDLVDAAAAVIGVGLDREGVGQEDVGPRPAVQGVGPRPTDDQVRVRRAGEGVGARPQVDRRGDAVQDYGRKVQRVGARRAGDRDVGVSAGRDGLDAGQ